MNDMTYHRDKEQPVKAKRGTCDGCGERKPIVTVSNWGNFCSECSENIWEKWNDQGQEDWDSRTKVMRDPESGEPFKLEDLVDAPPDDEKQG
jgi:hypothetical protein